MPIVFNLFSNDLDDGLEHTFNKLAGYTKLGGVARAANGCASQKTLEAGKIGKEESH